jgi:hypothetical protein
MTTITFETTETTNGVETIKGEVVAIDPPDLVPAHFEYPHIGASCEHIFDAFWFVATYMNDTNACLDATLSAKYVIRSALRNMVTRDAEARFGTPGRVLCENFFRDLDARIAAASREQPVPEPQ